MKNLIKKLTDKKIFFDILFILFLSLTPLLWFKKDTIMVGADNVFPLNPSVFLSGRLFTWIEHTFGQSQALIMGTIPIHFIDALPFILGLPLQITQKIVYVFWFFLIGISAYVLASVVNKESRVFKLTAVILYQFNFFILQGWWIGERTKFAAYIAFPLILAVFLKVYRGELKISRAVIYNSLILFIFNAGGLFGIPLFGGFFISLGAFVLFFSFLSFFRKQYDIIKKLFLVTLLSFFGFLLINAYYLLPALTQISSQYMKGVQITGGIQGLINWAGEISANASYINIFRLQGIPEWYDNLEHLYAKYYLTNPILIFVSFLWPVFILLALFLTRKKEKAELVLYFFLVYLLGAFFTAGTHPPLGFFYALLMKTVPGFIIFRSPFYKFAPAIFLASAFLIAFFIDHFQGKIKKIIFVFFIALVLIYHFPYFTGNFFDWREDFSTRNAIPKYIYDFGQWIENKELDGRILLLPKSNPDWQYDMYNWGYLSFQTLPTLLTNKSILVNNDKLNSNDDEAQLVFMMYAALGNKDVYATEKIASLLRVKYLLLRKDVKTNLDWSPVENPEVYEDILKNKFNFSRVETFGEWEVYKIPDSENNLPKIYTTENIDYFKGKIHNLSDYLGFSKNVNSFYVEDEETLKKAGAISSLVDKEYYIPPCLSCNYILKASPRFPPRVILPDSLFYPLILFSERRKVVKTDSKIGLYDYLGLTIKRISEIEGIVYQDKKLNESVLDDYISLLKALSRNFEKLSNFPDKFQAANDVNDYLDTESDILRDALGYDIGADLKTQKFNQVFDAIKFVKVQIQPYIYQFNPLNTYFYYLDGVKPSSYDIFLNKNNLRNIGANKLKLSFSIDGESPQKIELDLSSREDDLFLLAKKTFSNKSHTVLLTLPEIPNLTEEFQVDQMALSTRDNISCFISQVKNFEAGKKYKVKFNLPDDLKERLYYYVKRGVKEGKKIEKITKLKEGFVSDSYEDLISYSRKTDAVFVGFCGEEITKNILAEKLKLTINEVINPILIFKSEVQKEEVAKTPVTFTKINPTKYMIDLKVKNPAILFFMERFDKNWELNKFSDSHFQAMGYANGWLLNKPGNYKLTLEYKSQKVFYLGAFISSFTTLLFILFLIKIKK